MNLRYSKIYVGDPINPKRRPFLKGRPNRRSYWMIQSGCRAQGNNVKLKIPQLHLLKQLQGITPPLALATGSNRGAEADDVGSHLGRLHHLQQVKRMFPLIPLFTCADCGVVDDQIWNQVFGPGDTSTKHPPVWISGRQYLSLLEKLLSCYRQGERAGDRDSSVLNAHYACNMTKRSCMYTIHMLASSQCRTSESFPNPWFVDPLTRSPTPDPSQS